MEIMVDELVGSESVAAETPYPPSAQVSAFNGSSSGSRPASGRFTAADLFRQIQQSSPAPPLASPALTSVHRISLPGVYNTPFTPRPGETNGSLTRPSTSHRANGSAASPGKGYPPSSNAVAFEHQIAQMQHNIQNRTSPIQSFDPTVTPASSSCYQTPTGLGTFVRQNASIPVNSSPWVSSVASSTAPGTELPRQAPQASPFGAIGDPRPKNAKTPTSGQLG